MTTWELRALEVAPSSSVSHSTTACPSSDSSTASLVPTPTGKSSSPIGSLSDSASQRHILDSREDDSSPRHRFRSCLQQCFKALGLSVVYNLLAKRMAWPVPERKKDVMKRNQLGATLRCVVHLIPVSAAIALLVLNGSNHYIGGELSGAPGQDAQKLAALLFAAKLHELFMLASLSAIVITYIRKELVFGGGVTFGTLFSASQFKDLTFLWSPELWGTVYNTWQNPRTKISIISLLVVCSIAGLTVGPSTGVLMSPRLDEWPAGGTTFWINATASALNPKQVEATEALNRCKVDEGDQFCPANGWRVFNEEYFPLWRNLNGMGALPQLLSMPGRSSIRQFRLRARNVRDSTSSLLWGNAFTLATVAPSAISDALIDLERLWINAAANADIGNFKYRRDASFTTDTLQPVVLARCHDTEYAPNNSVTLEFPNLRNLTLSGGPGSAARLGSFAMVEDYLQISDTNITSAVEKLLAKNDRPSLYWIDDPHLVELAGSSILVVATIPKSMAGPAVYHTCSIDSQSARVTVKASRSAITHVSSEPVGYDNVGTFNATYTQIGLSGKWAEFLNPVVSSQNSANETVFSILSSTAGLWTNKADTEPVWYPIIVESILATLVANGIGRIEFGKTLAGSLVGVQDPLDPWSLGQWVHEILPQNGRLGFGGDAFVLSPDDEANVTNFTLKVNILGYAYSPEGRTQIAAMTALSLYVLLVLCHIGYSAVTGYYSSSWGSPSELTALAMNSDPTSKLENTGGGIETVEVFKEAVWVRFKNGRAQLVFRDTYCTEKLEVGREYA